MESIAFLVNNLKAVYLADIALSTCTGFEKRRLIPIGNRKLQVLEHDSLNNTYVTSHCDFKPRYFAAAKQKSYLKTNKSDWRDIFHV